MQTDTPESLRALAEAAHKVPNLAYPMPTLDAIVAALRRAADRLEADHFGDANKMVPEAGRKPEAGYPVSEHYQRVDPGRSAALAAARREGAEEMRERAERCARGMGASRNGTFPDRLHELIVERDFAIAGRIRALPLPGDER